MFSDVPSCFISSSRISALYLVSAAYNLDFIRLLISHFGYFASINQAHFCNPRCEQPVNCRWGPYGDWSECDGCTKTRVSKQTASFEADLESIIVTATTE